MDIPFIGQLATQGVLGLLLAISVSLNVASFIYFTKIIQTLNDKRVDDAKELTSKIVDPLNTIKANGELMISLFQRFLNGTK